MKKAAGKKFSSGVGLAMMAGMPMKAMPKAMPPKGMPKHGSAKAKSRGRGK